MTARIRLAFAFLGLALLAASAPAADLKKGTPDLKSVGPLTFGPEGVLFVADPRGGAIFAIEIADTDKGGTGPLNVKGVGDKIASLLGADQTALQIADLAVNPASGNAYLSVLRGRGPDAAPVLVRVNREGKVDEVSLKDVKFAKVTLPNANTAPPRNRPGPSQAITDLAYVDGKLFVAGLSNEEFASTLRAIPYPFEGEADKGAGIRIFHGAHGKFETASPVRTFAAYKINNEDHLLSAYTCTPLVKLPVKDLKPGQKVNGVTIAELGMGNQPLDMVIYEKGGKDYILLSNTNRGLMKITTQNIDKIEGITSPVARGGKAGLTYETLDTFKNDVVQLDRLDKDRALVLRKVGDGFNLETIALP